jgi:VanZ family protein
VTFPTAWQNRLEYLSAFGPVLIWVGVILFLSGSQGSAEQTSLIIGPLLKWLFPGMAPETLAFCHGVIRKFAHLSVYAVLAAAGIRALFLAGPQMLRRIWPVSVFALVIIVATIDEINQSTLAARTGSPYDVLLDCIGGTIVIASVTVYRWWRSRWRAPATPE